MPKKLKYKIGEQNHFKESGSFLKPDTNLEFEQLLKDHFENEKNEMKFNDMPIIYRNVGKKSCLLFGIEKCIDEISQ